MGDEKRFSEAQAQPGRDSWAKRPARRERSLLKLVSIRRIGHAEKKNTK